MIASPESRIYPMNGSSALKPVAGNFLNGFNSQGETEALRRNCNVVSGGRLIALDRFDNVISENLANMASHPHEYTLSRPVVLNPVSLDERGKIVSRGSGYRVVDMISPQERGGAVVDFMEQTEKKLAESKTGDVVIGISPPGVTGRFEGGKELIYEEPQIYVFKKGRGRLLEGITFIADLTYEQCLKLYGKYEKPDKSISNMEISERDRVADMVRRPIFITGGSVNFESVLDNIEAIMGGKVMRKANGINRTFEEARELLKDPKQLTQLPQECENVLGRYKNYLEANIGNINDEEIFGAIKQRMEIAMLEITKIIIGEEKEVGNQEHKQSSAIYINAFSGNNINLIDYNLIKNVYDEQIKFLMTRPGCLGRVGNNFTLTGQSLGDILSGASNPASLFGDVGVGPNCKVCGVNPRAEGGCGFCHGCASKAA